MTVVAVLLLGWFAWTLLEYVLHRFVFHERALGAGPSKEHLRHHAEVSWFASWRMKLPLFLAIIPATTVFGAIVAGWLGIVFVAGLLGGWQAYELLHRRIHQKAPLGAYGRWARRHHLRHHFGDPKRNHGVTVPWWDLVFGTADPEPHVAVPRKFAHALPWLVDGDRIAPGYEDTYRLR